jgi:triacylglycerol lipase
MRRRFALNLILVLACGGCLAVGVDVGAQAAKPSATPPCVILLHGLGRTSSSMTTMAQRLASDGYRITNLDYPSTDATIEALARDYLAPAIARCYQDGCRVLHMVSHSLGGILIRQYLQTHTLPAGSRIVMLSPPNQGSEIADYLKSYSVYDWVTGPAGQQLGTQSDSVPRQLAAVGAPIGVITGSASWNPFFSYLIPGPDDGKVAVAHARLEEMTDFLVVPASHTFIMDDDEVIAQTIHFLRHGHFDHKQGDQTADNPAGSPSANP